MYVMFCAQRLEWQMNDLTELHQNEILNLKQEVTSMEEKMEYQMEERARDMQEAIENCQTKVQLAHRCMYSSGDPAATYCQKYDTEIGLTWCRERQ